MVLHLNQYAIEQSRFRQVQYIKLKYMLLNTCEFLIHYYEIRMQEINILN